jgi:hypothetical protein
MRYIQDEFGKLEPGTIVEINADYHPRGGRGLIVSTADSDFFLNNQAYHVLYEGTVIPMYRYEFADVETNINKRPFVAHKGIWMRQSET